MEIPSMFSERAMSARFFRLASNDKHLPLRSEIIQNQKFEDSVKMVSPLTAFDLKLSFCAIRTNRISFVRIILDASQSKNQSFRKH